MPPSGPVRQKVQPFKMHLRFNSGLISRGSLLTACLLFSACTSLPKSVSDIPVVEISYSQANQSTNKGASVRWGGSIIEVENEQDSSLVQILFYPLDSYGRPQLNKASEGRFVIKSPEFLDPAVYAKDKEVTIVGLLAGDIERTIGKRVVRLPLITATAIHLWPASERDDFYRRGFGDYRFSPYFGYPGYPFYGRGYYGPYGW